MTVSSNELCKVIDAFLETLIWHLCTLNLDLKKNDEEFR